MKQFLLLATIVTLFVSASCTKGKFETVPQVVIKSLGPEEVKKGQIFTLVAEVTDKEGDLQDSIILVQKRFTGNTQIPPSPRDSTPLRIADFGFPNSSTIELRINFAYGEQIPGTYLINQEQVDRGLILGLIIQDKKKNKSTYAESKRILLKKV